MNEQSKAAIRRSRDPNFAHRYFLGDGIDIGCGHDSLANYGQLFPGVRTIRPWDVIFGDGDAQQMDGVHDATFDFAVSAHCLEHIHDPIEALTNWLRIVKPGGHVIATFPDEDLYEQGVFPSTFNPDHKVTFTLQKARSWSPVSVNLLSALTTLPPDADIRKVEILDHSNYPATSRWDQTMTPIAESAIEIVIRRRHPVELDAGGNYPENEAPTPSQEIVEGTNG